MRTVSKDYMVHMLQSDLPFTSERIGKDVFTGNKCLKIESNGHTYEIYPTSAVIACFDGLNYVKCYHPFFGMYYRQQIAKLEEA